MPDLYTLENLNGTWYYVEALHLDVVYFGF